MKLKSSAISIVLILITILSSLGIKNVTEDNIEDYIEKDAVAVADFIEDNFGKFVYEYNATSEEEWHATYIENRYDILISECGDEYDGVFLDFDGANGYAVVGNDYNLLDFNVNEESPYLGITFDKCMYSTVTGYLYELNGECLSVNPEYNVDESVFDTEFSASMKNYEGQDNDRVGCGSINDTDLYVNDKYGNGWKLSKRKYLTTTLNHTGEEITKTQSALSVYIEWKVRKDNLGNEYVDDFTEGNCWLVSAYNALQYLGEKNKKFKNLPGVLDTSLYNPRVSEPKIYSKYFDKNGNNLSKALKYSNGTVAKDANGKTIRQYDLKDNNLEFPDLYIAMRKCANKYYGKINSGSIYETAYLIEQVAKQYDLNIDTNVFYTLLTSSSNALNSINKGYPFLWGTFGDTYDNHLMMGCGYKTYSKTTGWWIFKVTSYKTFYEVKDGWNAPSRFFDVNGYYFLGTVLTFN